jgi:hypothetical protein
VGNRTRISPEEEFPEDLGDLQDEDVEVLNSKVHRQLDKEYVEEGGPDPETDARKDELDAELDTRDEEKAEAGRESAI